MTRQQYPCNPSILLSLTLMLAHKIDVVKSERISIMRPKITPNIQPSLKDIARLAGVSAMTVSRALHNPEKVSTETRKRIEEIACHLCYVPSQVGRSLSMKRTNLIGIIIPSIRNPIFADLLQGMSDVVRHNGYHILVGSSSGQQKEEEALVMAFLAHRPDGLVLHGTTHTVELRRMLLHSGLPVVETGGLEATPISMLVGYSNSDAAAAGVRHLVKRGYRKIGLITAPTTNNERAVRRREGYLRIIRESGLPESPSLMVEVRSNYDEDWSGDALCRLLEREPTIDAVFCAGYAWAIGSILECQRRGWSIPGHLAIVGFDDIPMASRIVPPLTTIRIPRYEIGRMAATLLLNRVASRPVEHHIVDVGFSLIERESA
jgi:LacI family gluconate utilization system Gnt-I transcriptional repressor